MTYRAKSGKFEVCRNCGAHLDHGEHCGCMEEKAAEGKPAENEAAACRIHI
jgi:hypothetical protein